ncbi:MAG: hypothetical protein J0L71_01550 [Candidatus Accumulibacter sp.]|nr:hypothetical protein [Accumulibacter sp.]
MGHSRHRHRRLNSRGGQDQPLAVLLAEGLACEHGHRRRADHKRLEPDRAKYISCGEWLVLRLDQVIHRAREEQVGKSQANSGKNLLD